MYTTPDEFKARYATLQATFASGKTKSVEWRKWQLKQFWWMMEDGEEALVAAMKGDLHRHPYESITVEIRAVKATVLEMLDHVEEWAKGEVPAAPGLLFRLMGKTWIRSEPYGVVMVIAAWNFALASLILPALAAVAAGNCVVLKPAEGTARTQNVLAELANKYLDSEAICAVTGGPQETAAMLEYKFNHICFTGGSRVGRLVAMAAAKHLTPTILELGGQAPAIVTRSADIELAAKRLANTKLANGGQVCLCVNHVFVHPDIHDQFVQRTVYWLQQFLREGTDQMARIVNEHHFDRVTGLLGKTEGTVVYGGDSDRTTRFVHPAVVTEVSVLDSLMSEELFAPILPVIKADVDAALATITSMPHPLALYIFSRDRQEIDRILDATNSGGVTVNDAMLHSAVPSVPFGGVGESGHGAYGGKWGFDAFSHQRTVLFMGGSWVDKVLSMRYPPFNMANLKYLALSKPKFRRGEAMAEQRRKQRGFPIGPLITLILGGYLMRDYLGISTLINRIVERYP
ncbi:hypothetical protein ASPZODRAFT_58612 [Penicilliopsis zonata CBS 506.65]|uniref:Aldehyde dehydrogenase n=1 Tax=Penicilliopsis zonata CBS 506.65 TaxID=1073090 RepID=A0A1L9SSM8_9EURO|nr:hypothetical protein ASPZODRAFT_58612 [Penicilliopsis zonata CBS 506.65]OJJ50133.1 hypothetical protein ASPZODRAFT_58612 [Penicilliopsis zonata CBS 506.65]